MSKITAALLLIIADSSDEAAKDSALKAAAEHFSDNSAEKFIAHVISMGEDAPVAAPVSAPVASAAPAAEIAVDAPVSSAAVQYRELDEDEEIEAGDEWKLKDGFRHNGGKQVMWRTVDGSIGDLVEEHEKSMFRRRI